MGLTSSSDVKLRPIVYLNGAFIPDNEATVSVFDRGYLFGDGVYEVVPVINGQLVDKEYFLQRLTRSLGELKIKAPCSDEELMRMLRKLVMLNDIKEGMVYMQVTRGVALQRTFNFPTAGTKPSLMAFATKAAIMNSPQAQGIKVVSTTDIRWKRRDIKSLQLLGQVMAKEDAVQEGAKEGWMCEDGYVTEGCSSSAYIVIKGNTVVTRPCNYEILPGVRRRTIVEIVKGHETYHLEERAFTLEEAYHAEEAFISSASNIVVPVVDIDGNSIGTGVPGPVTLALRGIYLERLAKESGLMINE